MFIVRNKDKLEYKKSLALIKKVRRVYNSCVTLEQLVSADCYATLALKQLLHVLPSNIVDTYELDFKRMHMYKYSSNLLIW
jgi:hypothetical protein